MLERNNLTTWSLLSDTRWNIRTDQLLFALLASLPFLMVYVLVAVYTSPFMALGLYAGLVIMLSIFRRPFYGLLFCLVIIFSGFVWGLGIKQGFLPVAIFSLAAVMTRKVYTLDFSFVTDRQVAYIFAFFGFMVLSIFGAISPLESFKYLPMYGKMFIFYFLIINVIETKNQIWACLAVLVFSNLGSVLYGFYSLFFAPHSAGEMMVKARMRGLTDDPNIMAMEIVFIMPALLLLIFNEGWKARSLLYMLGVMTLLAGIVASFSRGGTVALALVLAIVLYLKKSWPLFLLILTIALLLIVFVIPPTFWEHLLTLFDLGKFLADPSLRWRGRLMMGAIEQFTQNPILGIGVGNWILIANKYMSLRSLAVHNTFLQVAAETGVFGLLFFLLIFIRTFVNFSHSRKLFAQADEARMALLSQGLAIGLIGVSVDALFLSVQEAFVVWTIFGLSVAMRHVAESKDWKGTT